jgi:YVTN family beta-propeller protein
MDFKRKWTIIAILSMAFIACKDVPGPYLKQIAVIELPGEKGKRFDYLTIDYTHNYLLSAHLRANQLYVIDLKTNALIKTITNTPGAEGVEYIPELNKVYTSNWGDHTVGVIDMNKMEVIKKIPVSHKPDGNVYATGFNKLYVSDERAKTLFVIDVKKDEVIKKIVFGSETGMPQYDAVAKKIYLNLQDQNLFAVIDPLTDSVVAKYPVGSCSGNHGMALDTANRLAFLACEKNDQLTVFDLTNFKELANIKIPGGSDVVKYDPGLKRIYVACYDGYISIIHEDDRSHFTKLEDFKVQKAVHSLTVDVNTHRVYVPEQETDGKPAARMVIYEAIK